jgi:hypothetical protein
MPEMRVKLDGAKKNRIRAPKSRTPARISISLQLNMIDIKIFIFTCFQLSDVHDK